MQETNLVKQPSITIDYTPDGEMLEKFHQSQTDIRSLVGPVGSAKSSAAAWEVCYFIPNMLKELYNIHRTRWLVLRNTYDELLVSTQKTVFDWFSWGSLHKQEKRYTLNYNDMEIEILFRSCDRPEDVKKFKSLELTGYWIDESCEVADEIKKMLKNRIGRFPRAAGWPHKQTRRFGIETTNPPDIESSDYATFYGSKKLKGHEGFWQKPGENTKNLRAGYYDDLRQDYADDPDWIDRYIEGKPGIMKTGKNVYHNFKFDLHVAKNPLNWMGKQYTLYRGWDNTGNCPACIIAQSPLPGMIQVLKERWSDRSGIIDFAETVKVECNTFYPEASWIDWGDPAGEASFSKHNGGLTSNAQMMRDLGINLMSSIQDLEVRRESVEILLRTLIQGEPALQIDPSCARLINGFLGGYGYRRIAGTDIYQEKPYKNKFSHVHDALQYLLVRLFANRIPRKSRMPKRSKQRACGYGG